MLTSTDPEQYIDVLIAPTVVKSIMWRRVYFLLVLVRLYFALSPSYIHPDEHFQSPEVIAGMQLIGTSD